MNETLHINLNKLMNVSSFSPCPAMSKVDHEVQPNQGIRIFTLWDLTSGVDPEPLFIPKTAANIPIKPLTRIYNPGPKRYVPRLTPEVNSSVIVYCGPW